LGGVLQTFGQQHLAVCSGQLWPPAVAFKPALSRGTELVAPKLNATNTTATTTALKIRCMSCMLKPEPWRSKTILLRGQNRCMSGRPKQWVDLSSARAPNTG